ncbi:MAG: 50S ribosomal protein L20 [bacterium]
MPRATSSVPHRRRRNKIMKLAKGYKGRNSRWYKKAQETLLKALRNAYRDRKRKKRDFRRLWVARINAAARQNDLSYSKLIYGLKKAKVNINRKVLAELAVNDSQAFSELAALAKKGLET